MSLRDPLRPAGIVRQRNTVSDCSRPHVVVTGASSGIGRATAVRLAAAGQHVFAGVRDAADSPPGPDVTPLVLDVTDAEQIEAASAQVAVHVGASGLDGLVNNAGVGVTWPLELIPLDEFRRQFEVNVVGQLAVTQAFLPLLRRAHGRIVMIGSIGDRLAVPFGGALAASKTALATLTDTFRMELAPWDVGVVLVEPASIHTEAVDKLERDAARAVERFPVDGRDRYRDAYLRMIRAMATRERKGSPPQEVADTVTAALTSRHPRARYLVGKDAHRLATLAAVLPSPLLDAARRRLFRVPAPGSRRL